MILMVNGRQIPVSDGRVSYEDAWWLAGEVERLTELLHRKEMPPDHGYATTQGPIKVWNGEGPEGIGWELNNPPLRVYVRFIRRESDE